jgi:hypothetical protein
MADQTIAYTEEMVGSGHPTKSDTLNRLALVQHGTDGTHRRKVGTLTRAMDAADADVSYTGIGFRPTHIIFTANAAASLSMGFDDGSVKGVTSVRNTTAAYNTYTNVSIIAYEDDTKFQSGFIKTFDADGFTITWAKAGSPASANSVVKYMAFG